MDVMQWSAMRVQQWAEDVAGMIHRAHNLCARTITNGLVGFCVFPCPFGPFGPFGLPSELGVEDAQKISITGEDLISMQTWELCSALHQQGLSKDAIVAVYSCVVSEIWTNN